MNDDITNAAVAQDLKQLRDAIGYLQAREVAPTRYAYYRDKKWYVASTATLRAFGYDVYTREIDDAIALPFWWTFEERFVWALNVKTPLRKKRFPSEKAAKLAAKAEKINAKHVIRLTASLVTGAEVLAPLPAIVPTGSMR